ncbi:acetyltransferase [Xanthomonas citri pv. fuscans]|uniref:Acetyltransferase n=1 Tax=Xanthomonas citri pv. fuscans TaxID=366649 RepID=A0AB34Q6Z6_XANCI|nr:MULTISPECIES: GNAT family N-acetyltransferase [Xanthomonas]MEE5091186.1 GNAT family N-acetyltransferase [Xanthomonas euvesicatoria]AMV06515.1 acetyltransferase [Xanthomonas citri pv. aurantifolii]ARE58630.1 acetyltransferase [Xanthomonas citri pv. aurantifolii]ATS65505.1 GNAT family N-acetyltransferase [Xanthomonas citri pv. phaseoli var. fuscans]ATS67254.1 GNAT family N-acetyltransferase [Xanthomonas citri pv. phaseoli var. fuscans]
MTRLLSSEVVKASADASQTRLPGVHAITLRGERDADLPWLQDLYASTRRDELAPVPWPEATKRAFLQQQFALQRAHYRQQFADADFLIVQAKDLSIGRLYLHRAGAHHTLVDISLLPDWRGRGVGSQLIAHAQALARETACVLALHVLHANPAAQRLYARLGFVAGDSTQTHLQMHWHPRDHLLS